MPSPIALRGFAAIIALMCSACYEVAAPGTRVESISFTEVNATLRSGDSLATHVSVSTTNGEAVNKSAMIYTSTDSLVATVDSTGKVKAHAAGKATISAAVGTVVGNLPVTVVWRPVGILVFQDDSLVLAPGDQWNAGFIMQDTWNLVAIHATPAFASSDLGVATVRDAGLYTFAARIGAVSEGRAKITVSADGHSDILTVIVKRP